ncbi:MAG: hypothetical protein ACFFC1_20830 [Promethearchaeota archaeon]
MNFKLNKKYFAIITVRENELQNVIGFKRIKPTDKHFSFKNKTFPITIENPTYIKGNKVYYFYNFLDESLLLFNDKSNREIMNADIIDKILAKNIVNQLTANLNQKWKVELPMLLFAGGFGGLIGFIIASYI